VQVSEPYSLRAPVEREVAVADGGSVLLAGGLDAAQGSTTGVFRMNPATGALTSLGSVPQPFHDAAGAVIGNALYVFGGGDATSSSAVQRFDLATHASSVVAHLAHPLSDVAAAQTPDGVFLVGGYDGHVPRREIWRTRDGVHFTRVAMLPVGLRYPAVTAVGSTVYVAGGASSRVFAFDTSTGTLTACADRGRAGVHARRQGVRRGRHERCDLPPRPRDAGGLAPGIERRSGVAAGLGAGDRRPHRGGDYRGGSSRLGTWMNTAPTVGTPVRVPKTNVLLWPRSGRLYSATSIRRPCTPVT